MWLLVVIHRASLPLHLRPLRIEGHGPCEGSGSRVAACRRNVGTTSGEHGPKPLMYWLVLGGSYDPCA